MERIMWRRADGSTIEYCTLSVGPELDLSGRVIGSLDGISGNVDYEVNCTPDGATKSVLVNVSTLDSDLTISASRDMSGGWLVNGQRRPDLAACEDVDIGVTPSTNTLPIRRLRLQVGESRELEAAWFRFPDLQVLPLRQRYTRTGERTYVYESIASGYMAELEVNASGLVLNYSGGWEHLG